MYNLLVFLVLTSSVGHLKCQAINADWVSWPLRSNSVCPQGSQLDIATDACIIIVKPSEGGCPGGTEEDINDNCVPIGILTVRRSVDGCPDGYVRNDKGQCVPIAFRRVASPNAIGVGCIPGQTRDPKTGYCVSCPPGQERDGETNECVVIVRRSLDGCPEGSERNDKGECIPIVPKEVAAALNLLKAGCITGTTRDATTGACVGCPPGSKRDSETNECVVIARRFDEDGCPAGYFRNDYGQCIPVGLRRVAGPNAIGAGCIPGQTRDPNTGYCVSCPPGQERDGETNECVVITRRFDDDDCPAEYFKNELGQCIPSEIRRVASPNAIGAGCIPGTSRDPYTGECVSCPPGSERDGATNECVIILNTDKRRFLVNIGSRLIGLRRVASPNAIGAGCIPGQTRDPKTGYCVSCPPGQERDGETNECVTIHWET